MKSRRSRRGSRARSRRSRACSPVCVSAVRTDQQHEDAPSWPGDEHWHAGAVLGLVEDLLADKVVRVDPLDLGLAVHGLLLALLGGKVVAVHGAGRRERAHAEPHFLVLTPARDLVDGPDHVLGEAAHALARREVVQIQLVLDVDRVEKDERRVVRDVEGGKECGGVVRDEVREALCSGDCQ